MFAEVPFADTPFAALGGGVVEVTVNGLSMSLVLGCFHVSAWGEIPEGPAVWGTISSVSSTWSDIPESSAVWTGIPAASSSWSGVSVTTTIWEEIC